RERPARDGGRRARAPVGPRAAGLGREPGQPLRPRCPPDAGAPAPRPPLLLRPPHRHHRSLAGAPAGDHLLGQPQGEPEPGPARHRVAERAHSGQTRRSGDPYITHPVSVATILAELGSPAEVIAAALLHDTVEDTDYSLEMLREEFGEVIAVMVDGVTKLDKVTYGEAAQAETVRKMIVAMSRYVRVLL